MKLSAPIFRLKRRAKTLARDARIPLHQALDKVACEEGFARWSLLAARVDKMAPASDLLERLEAGDLLLLGARPGHGKTLLGLSLLVAATQQDRTGVFFTLDFTEADILDCFKRAGGDIAAAEGRFDYDMSDAISANYIAEKVIDALPGTVVVVDYLQLLDQRRDNPDLDSQVRRLKSVAREKSLIVVLISQIDRAYELSDRPCPDLRDIRLPNPVDLSLFDKACFLNDGEVRFQKVAA